MKTVTLTEAEKNLYSTLLMVANTSNYTIISRKDAQDAVIMSLGTFNSLMETLHLLKSPKNAKHLAESIKQYRHGKVKKLDIIDN